jgi:colanic acid/amylovoran biosynthesis glycosyltransferase
MAKVLIYRNVLLALSETFIQAQAGALKNFDVAFAGMKPAVDGLQVRTKPILVTEEDSLASKLKRNLFMNFGPSQSFLRRLKAENVSVMHAHFAIDGAVAMPIADALGIPMVCSLHGFDVTTKEEYLAKSRIGRIYLRRREELWKKVARFIPTSQYIRDRAVASGFPAEKMEVVYSGLNLSKFTPGAEPRNRNLILYVGRLIEKKGGTYLLKAVAKVAQRHPEVELAIIGDGPLRQSLEEEAKALNINCRFLGKLMHPEPGNSVHDWMRRARVFCGPSVEAADGNSEGVPFVFVESHALGLPAVSFNHAGIKEAVLHGETGLLAPERDIDTLADYLLRMLTDDPFWESCSKRAKTWVWERFDLNVLTRQLEVLYGSVIAAGTKKNAPAVSETVGAR